MLYMSMCVVYSQHVVSSPIQSACSVVVCTLAGDRESETTSNPIIIGASELSHT